MKSTEKLYMNPATGSVDTLAGWDFDTHEEAIVEGLVRVEWSSEEDYFIEVEA